MTRSRTPGERMVRVAHQRRLPGRRCCGSWSRAPVVLHPPAAPEDLLASPIPQVNHALMNSQIPANGPVGSGSGFCRRRSRGCSSPPSVRRSGRPWSLAAAVVSRAAWDWRGSAFHGPPAALGRPVLHRQQPEPGLSLAFLGCLPLPYDAPPMTPAQVEAMKRSQETFRQQQEKNDRERLARYLVPRNPGPAPPCSI